MKSLVTLLLLIVTFQGKAVNVSVVVADGTVLNGQLQNGHHAKSALLLHQCNRDQSMWQPLLTGLADAGFSTMTVDFRGYGKSKTAIYDVDRSDEDYRKATQHMQSDVVSIYHAWKRNTAAAQKRVVIGASCGGGGAGILASDFADIDGLVLFSPSMRDYWFPTQKWGKLKGKNQLPILAIASKQDTNAMGAINKVTEDSQSPHTEYIRYNGRLHGQPLFKHDANLAQKMLSWITRISR